MLSTSRLVVLLVLIGSCLIYCDAYRVIWPTTENGGDDSILELPEEKPSSSVALVPRKNSIISESRIRTTLGNREFEQDNEVLSFTDTLLQNIAKRTAFANTEEEIQNLEMEVSDDEQHDHRISSVIGIGLMKKRTEQTEHHSGGCEAKKMWVALGSDHFPRFIKSYNCTSDTCNRSFGECRPKSYSVKVLRMNSPENASLLEEGCDPHLPEKLRCDWKLVPVMVTTYCECYTEITPFGR